MEQKQKVIATIIALVLIITAFYVITKAITQYTGYTINNDENSSYDSFAKCLSGKSVLYVREGCHFCAQQEELFGSSFKLLNTVQCLDEPAKCGGLRGVPAWDIEGSIYYGVQNFSSLEKYTGCTY